MSSHMAWLAKLNPPFGFAPLSSIVGNFKDMTPKKKKKKKIGSYVINLPVHSWTAQKFPYLFTMEINGSSTRVVSQGKTFSLNLGWAKVPTTEPNSIYLLLQKNFIYVHTSWKFAMPL